MAAPTSRFLNKLSPELRLRIYGHVFGSSRVIKPADSNTALDMRKDPTAHIATSFAPPATDVLLDVSILISNRFIFTEALPVLRLCKQPTTLGLISNLLREDGNFLKRFPTRQH